MLLYYKTIFAGSKLNCLNGAIKTNKKKNAEITSPHLSCFHLKLNYHICVCLPAWKLRSISMLMFLWATTTLAKLAHHAQRIHFPFLIVPIYITSRCAREEAEKSWCTTSRAGAFNSFFLHLVVVIVYNWLSSWLLHLTCILLSFLCFVPFSTISEVTPTIGTAVPMLKRGLNSYLRRE